MIEKRNDVHAFLGVTAIRQWVAKNPMFTPEQRAELEQIIADFEIQRSGIATEDAALFKEIMAVAELEPNTPEEEVAFEKIRAKIKKIEDENPDPLPHNPPWRPGHDS